MRVWFCLRSIENGFFNDSVCFLVSIDFLMRVFVFWSQALWKTALCFLLFEFIKF